MIDLRFFGSSPCLIDYKPTFVGPDQLFKLLRLGWGPTVDLSWQVMADLQCFPNSWNYVGAL